MHPIFESLVILARAAALVAAAHGVAIPLVARLGAPPDIRRELLAIACASGAGVYFTIRFDALVLALFMGIAEFAFIYFGAHFFAHVVHATALAPPDQRLAIALHGLAYVTQCYPTAMRYLIPDENARRRFVATAPVVTERVIQSVRSEGHAPRMIDAIATAFSPFIRIYRDAATGRLVYDASPCTEAEQADILFGRIADVVEEATPRFDE